MTFSKQDEKVKLSGCVDPGPSSDRGEIHHNSNPKNASPGNGPLEASAIAAGLGGRSFSGRSMTD
jgi:hypothetical protein